MRVERGISFLYSVYLNGEMGVDADTKRKTFLILWFCELFA